MIRAPPITTATWRRPPLPNLFVAYALLRSALSRRSRVRSPTQAESEGTKCKRPLSCPVDSLAVTKGVADLTGLLQAWSRGEAEALEQLAPLVHRELRGMARRMLSGERQADGWQPTDLVQESYVRLLDWRVVRWQNRAHFFATTARMMRRVLVDAARARRAAKRGGGVEPRRSRAWTSRRQSRSSTCSRSKTR